MSISTILATARSHTDEIIRFETQLRRLRVQLCGNWPESDSESKVAPAPESLTNAFDHQQGVMTKVLADIDGHMEALHDVLGDSYHPLAGDGDKDA